MKKVVNRRKRSKAPNEVKPFENINKNLQAFLDKHLAQKEVFLSYQL